MPLRSSAAAALAIRSSEASSVNSADTAASGCATTCWSVTAYLRQPAVDERHGHGSLADGRCAAFDRPAAHVPGGEHTGQVGLQRQRLLGSGQLPPGAPAASPPVTRYPAVLVTSPLPAAPSVRGCRRCR